LAAKKKFAFVDGLSGLFSPKQQQKAVPGGERILMNSRLQDIPKQILSEAQQLKGSGKVLLVIDQLDLLLAAGGEGVDAVGMGNMLMGLREVSVLSLGRNEKY
jgi:elongator complex protein 6